MPEKLATQAGARKSWRDVLKIHPAAELFPLMSEAELKELAEDIRINGLQTRIVIWDPEDNKKSLLDGRNRLDALALLGLLYLDDDGELGLNKWWVKDRGWVADDRFEPPFAPERLDSGDPYALALSFNVHRRHLNAEQKRELIAKVLKAKPEASNLQIAKQVKADDKTVAKVRNELEGRSEIPNVDTRSDTKGRGQPARRSRKKKVVPLPDPSTDKSFEDLEEVSPGIWGRATGSAEISEEQRRADMARIDEPAEPEHKAPSVNGSEAAADETEDPKPGRKSNRFANVANARKRRAALEPLILWISHLPEWELRQVFEAIGVHQILASFPDAWLPVVAQWVAERQASKRPIETAGPVL
jgi:hypothetical protein